MTAENFFEIFDKYYQKKNEKRYMFRIPSGLNMLGEKNRVMGIGISPCRFIGIRLSDEEKFYIRDTESAIVYESDKSTLDKCDNIYKDVFKAIGRIVKVSDIKGAEILFHNECPEIVPQSYVPGIIMSFFHLLKKPVTPYDYYAENDDFEKDELIGITSLKNHLSFFENGKVTYYPVNFDSYKIIIMLPGEGKKESICNNSKESMILAEECIRKGNIQGLANIIKASAAEYFSDAKHCEGLRLLHDSAAFYSEMCGIYENYGVFAFAENERVDEIVKNIDNTFFDKTGKRAEFYICKSSGKEVDFN